MKTIIENSDNWGFNDTPGEVVAARTGTYPCIPSVASKKEANVKLVRFWKDHRKKKRQETSYWKVTF